MNPAGELIFDPKLILFDYDGTLAQFKTGILLPNVKETFAKLPYSTKLAICTNQGGVGLRYWMIVDGFGSPQNYPSETKIRSQVQKTIVEIDSAIRPYFCFAYQSVKKGTWNPTPDEFETDDLSCWRRDWRKPQPGMLLQAMADFGVSPEETLFVGDWAEDELAASAAGCFFQWDYVFFNREKVQTE